MAIKVKVAKDYSFRDEIYQLVEYCCTSGQVPNCQLPSYQKKARETKGKVRLLMIGTHSINLKGSPPQCQPQMRGKRVTFLVRGVGPNG